MKFKVPENLQEYVTSNRYCDVDSPVVKKKAESLTEGTNSPKEAAFVKKNSTIICFLS